MMMITGFQGRRRVFTIRYRRFSLHYSITDYMPMIEIVLSSILDTISVWRYILVRQQKRRYTVFHCLADARKQIDTEDNTSQ